MLTILVVTIFVDHGSVLAQSRLGKSQIGVVLTTKQGVGLVATADFEPLENTNDLRPRPWMEPRALIAARLDSADAGRWNVKWENLPDLANREDSNTDIYYVMVHVNGNNNLAFTTMYGRNGRTGDVKSAIDLFASPQQVRINPNHPSFTSIKEGVKQTALDTIRGAEFKLPGKADLIINVLRVRGNLTWSDSGRNMRTNWDGVVVYSCPLQVVDQSDTSISYRVTSNVASEDFPQRVLRVSIVE